MAEPETDISLRAAEVAADVSEEDRPQERHRLVRAFTKAAGSGARVAGRGTRAGRSGAGSGTRAARQRAGTGTSRLVAQVVAMAPRLRVRDQAALQAQFPGKSGEEIADALIEGAARASAAVGGAAGGGFVVPGVPAFPGRGGGGAAGVVSVLPVLPAFPAEVVAETLVVVGIEIKLVAELHEAYGTPAPGKLPERMSAYLAAWAHRRGVSPIP